MRIFFNKNDSTRCPNCTGLVVVKERTRAKTDRLKATWSGSLVSDGLSTSRRASRTTSRPISLCPYVPKSPAPITTGRYTRRCWCARFATGQKKKKKNNRRARLNSALAFRFAYKTLRSSRFTLVRLLRDKSIKICRPGVVGKRLSKKRHQTTRLFRVVSAGLQASGPVIDEYNYSNPWSILQHEGVSAGSLLRVPSTSSTPLSLEGRNPLNAFHCQHAVQSGRD